MLIKFGASLSRIPMFANAPVLAVAPFVGLDKPTLAPSFPSKTVSSMIVTWMVLDVSAGPNVNVPDTGLKSDEFAAPITIPKLTECVRAVDPPFVTVNGTTVPALSRYDCPPVMLKAGGWLESVIVPVATGPVMLAPFVTPVSVTVNVSMPSNTESVRIGTVILAVVVDGANDRTPTRDV